MIPIHQNSHIIQNTTVIDATGAVDDKNDMSWVIASPGAIPTGHLGYTQVISDVRFKDSLHTNGGKIAQNKNFAFDSEDQETGLYNIEAEKVLTYASTEGAHMVGEEQYTCPLPEIGIQQIMQSDVSS